MGLVKSKESLLIDSRMKSKVRALMDLSQGDVECYSVQFKDIEDTFHFGTKVELQLFIHNQVLERFYDKELRKGYFDYINEHGETLRYYVESKRGTLTLIKEECITKGN